MVEMEKSLLKKMCREHDLYVTPAINDKLYLHYKGFRRIQNLDEYTGLKVVWLEGNGLPRIEGLEKQTLLKTLYLQENLIQKIENLDSQSGLDTLNLSQNQISRIENLSHMKELTSLALKANYLTTAADLEHVLRLPNLSVLDIQGNRINDPQVLEVLAKMPNLKVLYLQGNDVVKAIKQYRKTVIYRCRKLKYLDDRPVFDDERRRIDTWGKALDANGGDYKAAQEAERVEMEAIRQEKKDRDRMNFLHFEQLMAEGRRRRQEEEEKEKARLRQESNPTSNQREQPEINPFSGEKIVPTQDCEFLQHQREKRWGQVVNAPDAWVGGAWPKGDNQTEEAPTTIELATTIPVDASRMELLHQCATVGVGIVGTRDVFVEAAFRVADNSPMPPPAPVIVDEHRERIKEKAKAKVLELRTRKQVQAQFMTPATQLINSVATATLLGPLETCSQELYPQVAQPFGLPPPAPSALTTNVDELD